MTVDIKAAERFVLANARVLDRHRLAVMLHGAPTETLAETGRSPSRAGECPS